MLDLIHHKKFPFTELQGKLPYTEKPSRKTVMNQTHPIETSIFILLICPVVLSSKHCVPALQYSDWDICWKVWQSKLSINKTIISSPKHPDQLQRQPSIQHNDNQIIFFGSTVAN
jgi:hypothetical protein